MMMAFRRWGHFYLALSNEALRKRTQEQNQARSQVCGREVRFTQQCRSDVCLEPTQPTRCGCNLVDRCNMFRCRNLLRVCCAIHQISQRDTPEKLTLSIKEQPRNERGRSRRSSSAGRRSSGGQRRLQLSSSDVQAMVEQEAESVARELAGEPSLSLLALADARKEMDDIAMKAQVRRVQPSQQLPSKVRHSPRLRRSKVRGRRHYLLCVSISGWLTSLSTSVFREQFNLVVGVGVCITDVDVCSHRAQATLGVLYAQPPLTQDANVATDGTMVIRVVEPVPEGKKVEESVEGWPSPGGSANASVDVSLNDGNAPMSAEAPGVDAVGGETPLTAPPVVVSTNNQQQQQQQGKASDLPDATDAPEVRAQV